MTLAVAEPYIKTSRGYFGDYGQTRRFGTNIFGNPFDSGWSSIVQNPMSWGNSLNGFKNPMWRTQIRNNENATTVMTASMQSVMASYGYAFVSIRQKSVTQPGNYDTTQYRGYPIYGFPSTTAPLAEVITETRNRALRKFHSKVNAVRSSLEGGQSVGEWKQLLGAVTNPLGSLRRFTLGHLKYAKKRIEGVGKYRGKRFRHEKYVEDLTKTVADTYLEYVFGWNPLVSDVAAGMVGLQTRFDQDEIVVVDGRANKDYQGSNTRQTNFQEQSNVYVCYQDVVTRSNIKIIYKGGVKSGAYNNTKSWAQTTGLLPERFIPTIWELIPYSFVADYFVNVGDMVNALAFRRSWLTWGQVTTRIVHEKKYHEQRIDYKPTPGFLASTINNGFSASGGDAILTRKTVERLPIDATVSLMPELRFSYPVKQKPWLNMTALLVQPSFKLLHKIFKP